MLGDFVLTGKKAVGDFMATMPAAPPKFTVTETIGEADKVVCRGEMSMQNKDGQQEDYAFCDVYTFKNEVVAGLITYMVKLKQN